MGPAGLGSAAVARGRAFGAVRDIFTICRKKSRVYRRRTLSARITNKMPGCGCVCVPAINLGGRVSLATGIVMDSPELTREGFIGAVDRHPRRMIRHRHFVSCLDAHSCVVQTIQTISIEKKLHGAAHSSSTRRAFFGASLAAGALDRSGRSRRGRRRRPRETWPSRNEGGGLTAAWDSKETATDGASWPSKRSEGRV